MQLPATRAPVTLNENLAPHIVVIAGGVTGILATRLGHLLGRSREALSRDVSLS
jgi:hypothetical protein